jgi:hypothetical protein
MFSVFVRNSANVSLDIKDKGNVIASLLLPPGSTTNGAASKRALNALPKWRED